MELLGREIIVIVRIVFSRCNLSAPAEPLTTLAHYKKKPRDSFKTENVYTVLVIFCPYMASH